MTILLLKGFNNYYNRIVKGYPSEGYKSRVGDGNWWEYFDINFYQNDGVETTQTINFSDTNPAPDAVPDYLVAFYPDSTAESPHVHSRWFVMECKHNRKNQFVLTLRRDLFVDFEEEIKSSTVYVEKAAVPFSASDIDDALYNSEDFSASWEKYAFAQLTQGTGHYYVIAYLASNLDEITITDGDYDVISFGKLQACGNQPYSILAWECFPPTENPSIAQRCAMRLAALFSQNLSGAGALYDIQVLPYVPSGITSSPYIDAALYLPGSATLHTVRMYNIIKDSFSFSGKYGFTETINNNVSAKTVNQLYKIRLCSPGGGEAFEFNQFKNGIYTSGGVNLNFDITLKPQSPYIHIYPEWGGLYRMSYYGDERGLYVHTDFSLPTITEAWSTYALNNKNYLNSFNREIDTLELQNKWGLASDIASAVGGTVSGATTGAALAGPGGAIAAGVGSAIAGTIGVIGNQQLREDALDLRKDQFNYSLENIQAQPIRLTRCSAFSLNAPITPYMEFYRAPEQSEEAFKNKIKWNGAKIGRIGTFQTYWNHLDSSIRYMKCKLVRIDIEDDYHVVSEIGKELDKGFYKM